MHVDINKFWIEGVLLDAYPRFHEAGGADLNGNGTVDAAERFRDFDHNGVVGNRRDYQLYLRNHRAALSRNVAFFRWGERLSVENRIHPLIYLESDLHDPARVQEAYIFIAHLVTGVRTYIAGRHFSAPREAQIYYRVMQRSGIAMGGTRTSFLEDVHDRYLDCDSSSFTAMAIGDERGLRLDPVPVPHHVFLQGTVPQGIFNIDMGNFIMNPFYDYGLNRSRLGYAVSAYLYTANDAQVESMFLGIRGVLLNELDRSLEALLVYDRAISLNQNAPDLHHNRGNACYHLGRYAEALDSLNQALNLDPNISSAHVTIGAIFNRLGRYTEALPAFEQAIRLNRRNAEAHFGRGIVLTELGRDPEEILEAYNWAISFDRNHVRAYSNSGNILWDLGRYRQAVDSYETALRIDPNYTEARDNRAHLLESLGFDY